MACQLSKMEVPQFENLMYYSQSSFPCVDTENETIHKPFLVIFMAPRHDTPQTKNKRANHYHRNLATHPIRACTSDFSDTFQIPSEELIPVIRRAGSLKAALHFELFFERSHVDR
ncbi:hypothetical protein CEXT_745351 [Caerostris extrusa]|uniref:Uncharacterized protein n=1 Tax=Caerostris extrusa TaxID=172846 RepID=A0AAV4TJL3_CAEEX|nr:hypothetical protein CEXT_745351 [Caerostris extrusa]